MSSKSSCERCVCGVYPIKQWRHCTPPRQLKRHRGVEPRTRRVGLRPPQASEAVPATAVAHGTPGACPQARRWPPEPPLAASQPRTRSLLVVPSRSGDPGHSPVAVLLVVSARRWALARVASRHSGPIRFGASDWHRLFGVVSAP